MPDNRIQGTRRTAWLDDMRKSHSCEEIRDLFQRLYSDDAIQAINMLNDEKLSFRRCTYCGRRSASCRCGGR